MPICQNASNRILCAETENLAFWEYKEFNDAYAKAYIKKNSKRFIKRLLDEGDEKRAVDFLKTGFVSKVTLKTLLPIAKKKNRRQYSHTSWNR